MIDIEISKALFLGFSIGLTGVLVPGPLLFATIESTIKKGWIAGPKVVFGHILIEVLLCISILRGAASFFDDDIIYVISTIGGLALVIFGLLTLNEARTAFSYTIDSQRSSFLNLKSSPIILGIVSTVSNPYLLVWWLTASGAIMLKEYELGVIVAIAYVFGHWIADISWFITVSGAISHKKTLFTQKVNSYILYTCGSFLVVFGFYFILRNS